jgi:hypothetical protein
MEMGANKTIVCLLFSLLLTITVFVPVNAEKEELSGPAEPGRPNVVWDVTNRRTAIIHIINTTPYDMDLKNEPFQDRNGIDQAVQTVTADPQERPFVFTPSGIPENIPARSGTSFVVSWMDTYYDGHFNVYPDAQVIYTMRNVDASPSFKTGSPMVSNVDILFAFNRVKETTSLESGVFKTSLHTAALLVDTTEFLLEGNPVAFVGALMSAAELTEDVIDINEENDDSDQVYFAAYPIAKSGSLDSDFPGAYTIGDEAVDKDEAAKHDGLYAQHGPTGAGNPQTYIIAYTSLLREQKADDEKLNGHLPVVFVTLVTMQDVDSIQNANTQVSQHASPAGHRISAYLQREGLNGQKAFIRLARTLSPNDARLLTEAYKTIRSDHALSHEQEALLVRFAVALEKMPMTPNNDISEHKTK